MDGSSGDGTTSPSADMSSPPSLQTSPNPDSSGLLGDSPSVVNSGGPSTASGLLGPSGTISPKTGQPVSAIAGLCSPGTAAGLGPPRTSPTSPPGAILPPVVVSKPFTPPMSTAPTVGLSSGCSKHEPGGGGGGGGGGHNPHTSSQHVNPMGLISNNIRNGAPSHPAVSVGGYGLGAPRLERPVHPVSPPGIPTDATANDCRLIDYRGAKVAAFYVGGDYLLCLPQAFELFLKHLVGGLHTVYTKLKRLDITPIVCNVEQVRILRGLGAIQPGVNRCKLLSCKDFDILYKDCTTASLGKSTSLPFRYPLEPSRSTMHRVLYGTDIFRPGRPPKRATMVGMNHASPNHSMLLKKSRLDGDYSGYENGHIAGDRLDKAHMLPNGYSHHAAAQAAMAAAAASGAPPHINPLPFMALNHAAAHHNSMTPSNVSLPLSATSHGHGHGLAARSENSVIKERPLHGSDPMNSSRLRDDRPEVAESKDRLYGFDSHRMKDQAFLNGYFWLLAGASANGHSPVLNLSQHSSRAGASNGAGDQSGSETAYNECPDDDDNDSEDDEEDDREQDLSDNPDVSSTANTDRLPSSQPLAYPNVAGDTNALAAQSASSMETLLRNIQGLLKVAADNARQQERQINLEKAELKMEIIREREVREGLEKQLMEEQRTRILYQKRLKKEKRSRRRVQEQLESEVKKRAQYEEALRNSSAETLRLLNESLAQELERERNARAEAEHKMQDCPMSV